MLPSPVPPSPLIDTESDIERVIIEKKIKNQKFVDNLLANHWEKEEKKKKKQCVNKRPQKRSHTPFNTDTETKE